MAALRIALAALVLAGLAAPAQARSKVPKALAGVDLTPQSMGDSYESITASVIPGIKRMGGRAVIAFTERYVRIGPVSRDRTPETELAIVAADTKEYLFFRLLVGDGFADDLSWRDFDGDGEKELVVTTPTPKAQHVWQVRYGNLVEVGAKIARCGRADGDHAVLGDGADEPTREAAVARFVADIDYGTDERSLHCDYADAAVASRLLGTDYDSTSFPWLEPGEAAALSSVAVDCPASDWAARHGSVLEPDRAGVFVSDDHHLELFAITVGRIAFISDPVSDAVIWAQPWILDEHLFVFAETAKKGEKAHHALVIDAVTAEITYNATMDEGETAALQVAVSKPGRFELVATGPTGSRTVWFKDTRTWVP